MKIALLNTKPTLRANYLLESFAKGLEQFGDRPIWVMEHNNFRDKVKEADVAVQVCAPNRHHSNSIPGLFRIEVNAALEAAGKRVLTIDTGFLKCQSDMELEAGAANRKHEVLFDLDNKDTYEAVLKDVYYSVGFEGLKRNADYCNTGSPPDRWKKLGIPIKPWRKRGNHILLIGQTLHGLSSQHIDIYEWYGRVVKQIRTMTRKLIVFRHHPRLVKIRGPENKSRIDKDNNAIKKAVKDFRNFRSSTGWTLEEDLHDAWCAVAFTSNAAVPTVVSGIPLFSGDPACMAWPVSGHSLHRIDRPPTPKREQWANDLAYAQWTVAEFMSGECWKHFRSHALKPRSSGRALQ